MPPLTRSQAREWRAEGKDFEDPSRLGKKAPKDPPRITKKKTTGAGPRAIKPSSAGGAGEKIKMSASGKRTTRRDEKKRKRTTNGANAAGQAREDAAVRRAPVASQTHPTSSAEDHRIGMRGFQRNGIPDTGNELYIPGLSSINTRTSKDNNTERLSIEVLSTIAGTGQDKSIEEPPTEGMEDVSPLADASIGNLGSPQTGVVGTESNNFISVSRGNVAGANHNTRPQGPTTENSPEDIMDGSLDNPIGGVGESQAAGQESRGIAAEENRNTRPQESANEASLEHIIGDTLDDIVGGLGESQASAGSETRSLSPESQCDQKEEPTPHLKSLDKKELAVKGGLEYGRAAMPSLNNTIHDIWNPAQPGKWKFDQQVTADPTLHVDNGLDHGQEQSIVDTLTPAMRLATFWLTRPEYRDFWATILYAPCTFDEERRFWRLAKETVDMTPARCNEMDTRLQTIAWNNHFIFDRTPNWASTRSISPIAPLTWRGSTYAFGYVTTLDPGFMHAVWPVDRPGNAKRWQEHTTSNKLRFFFFLAVQLGGQAAELLWLDRCRRENRGNEVGRKPCIYVHDLEHLDMNLAFEEFVLGGRLHALNKSAPMCSDGLALRIFEGVVDPDPGFEIGIVHMEGINQCFSLNWWNTPGDRRAKRIRVVTGQGDTRYVLYDWAGGR
ncbi:MAG: hypothetical protein L6R38_004309 [Xanthoria sp. 2 TBL-2021]|nr:MAG: hypothetical protein L6R38_004309 [Xanthoria sp. 2 TBL-2021]